MALYRGSTKVSGIGRVPGTEYMTQATYDALPSSKLTDNVNRGIYTDNEDTTLEKFIKNGVEYCLGGGGGVKYGNVDMIIVGGGGGGGMHVCSSWGMSGGGGAGGYIEKEGYLLTNEANSCNEIVVGSGGTGVWVGSGCNGGDTCAFGFTAFGGGGGGGGGTYLATSGGSGGGGGSVNGCGCVGCGSQGNKGGNATGNTSQMGGGGGGGAGSAGCNVNSNNGANGGAGKCSCISGECVWYAGGGGGGGFGVGGTGGNGGGDGACNGCISGCSATTYGSGGGGGGYRGQGGAGCQGIVIIRYKTDGSCGIKNNSYGGTKYTCGDYTIHCFCAVGTDYFIPVFK